MAHVFVARQGIKQLSKCIFPYIHSERIEVLTLSQNHWKVLLHVLDVSRAKARLVGSRIHGIDDCLASGRDRACGRRSVGASCERGAVGLHSDLKVLFDRWSTGQRSLLLSIGFRLNGRCVS